MGAGASRKGQRAPPRSQAPAVRSAWIQGDAGPAATPDAVKMAVLGFDSAGKTSLATVLRSKLRSYRPLSRSTSKDAPWERLHVDLRQGSAPLDLWVASGFVSMREHWSDVIAGAGAIVFLIDSYDTLRAPLAWSEIVALTLGLEESAGTRLLIAVTRNVSPACRPGVPELNSMTLRESVRGLASPALPEGRWAICDFDLVTGTFEDIERRIEWLLFPQQI
eukprot:TRINITY_DN14898_c0_g1_i1.p1 TRINITY_DN14898_c0_g1~~TRINITY_DN14898_c0_g1_i1.p1  ORF type:complete len:249 (+),score=10.31 TRINITY_DN14898_c0_g1_i1:87-749(+)